MKEELLQLAYSGDTRAMYELAVHFRNVEKNHKKSLEWFLKSALLECDDAQYEVGCTYKYGWHVNKDYDKAFIFLSLAAEQNSKSALFELGGLYELGLGVERNMEKALSLYKAYEQAE